MTQAEFADVTGLGITTAVRWENGSMNHARAYDRYIQLLEDPEVMRQLKEAVQPSGPRNPRTVERARSESTQRARDALEAGKGKEFR